LNENVFILQGYSGGKVVSTRYSR